MKLIFKDCHNHTPDIATFIFVPKGPVDWRAGQSIRLEMPGLYGSEERRFTISSAPYEKDIHITTRISDSTYKQTLSGLVSGAEVNAYAVEGNFTWRDSGLKHTFVAGGIGITPFYAMLKQRAYEQLPIAAHLIYGTGQGDHLFRDELDALQVGHPEFTVSYISKRRFGTGDITKHMQPGALVYLAGPQGMVNELAEDLLALLEIDEHRLVLDRFTGASLRF